MGFFAKAGSDSCALFLNDSAFVCDGLRRTDVSNELLNCRRPCERSEQLQRDLLRIRELILEVDDPANGAA
jgi:hypothetical protein